MLGVSQEALQEISAQGFFWPSTIDEKFYSIEAK
jgi:hypothetical protein